jgi:transcriptional regulator with XRE-family HTH domain
MNKQEQKNQIREALETYMKLHGLSQNDIAKRAGVNAAYLIQIRKGSNTIAVKDKDVEIDFKYFVKLAEMMGMRLETTKTTGVKKTETLEFMTAHLQEAKDNSEAAWLVAETGAGKTFALDIFKRKYPQDVFSIKIGYNDSLNDILDKLYEEIKVNDTWKGSKTGRITIICRHLKNLKRSGRKTALVFDESEYMRATTLCTTKEFYDQLNYWCSIIYISTPELEDKIDKLIEKKAPGIAQWFRRLKFKKKTAPEIDRTFELFLDGIEPELKMWLQDNCFNYGELTDVLNPAMREAERLNQPLTLKLVLTILNRDY